MLRHKKKVARLLQTVGDPARLGILCVLFSSQKPCVSEIAQKLGQSVATASHHMRVLAKAGILTPVRVGKQVCYQLVDEPMIQDLKKYICRYDD